MSLASNLLHMRFLWNGLGEIPDFLGLFEAEGKNFTFSVAEGLGRNGRLAHTALLESVKATEPEWPPGGPGATQCCPSSQLISAGFFSHFLSGGWERNPLPASQGKTHDAITGSGSALLHHPSPINPAWVFWATTTKMEIRFIHYGV